MSIWDMDPNMTDRIACSRQEEFDKKQKEKEIKKRQADAARDLEDYRRYQAYMDAKKKKELEERQADEERDREDCRRWEDYQRKHRGC